MERQRFTWMVRACLAVAFVAALAVVYRWGGISPASTRDGTAAPVTQGRPPAALPASPPPTAPVRAAVGAPAPKVYLDRFKRLVNDPAHEVWIRGSVGAEGRTLRLDSDGRRELLERLNRAWDRADVRPVGTPLASRPAMLAEVTVWRTGTLGRVPLATVTVTDGPDGVALHVAADAELSKWRSVVGSTELALWLESVPKNR